EELRHLIAKLVDAEGSPVPIREYLIPSTSNVITALLFGTTYSFDNPKRKYLDKLLARLFEIIMSGSAVDFQPYWFRKIAARIPYTRSYALRKASLDLHAFIRERVKEHQKTIDPNFHRDFIDGYLNKVTEHQSNPNSHFREAYILGNAIDFFVAGTGTVAASIQWHLFNCAKNPDTVQAVIQREINDVIGRERKPAWEDRSQMHFTMACIWEMLRWRTVVPLGLPRGTREDTFFDDYFIPKDTVVLANLLAVHRDPELWERPDEFDPTRFMKKDGTGLVKKPEHLIAFSVDPLRVSTINKDSLTREDTFFDNYFIPKDTVVLANLLAVHRDPELWERPDEFDPTRFMKKDGTGLMERSLRASATEESGTARRQKGMTYVSRDARSAEERGGFLLRVDTPLRGIHTKENSADGCRDVNIPGNFVPGSAACTCGAFVLTVRSPRASATE
ncbi:hypothetical protein HPB47_026810, partial [Ixodes persulcatus]